MLRGFSGFREMLAARQKAVNSLVCVGLDPLLAKVPECIMVEAGEGPDDMSPNMYVMARWMIDLVNATAPFTSLYKPQSAHWERFPGGKKALQIVVTHIHGKFPDIPVFEDCKRGDIDRTQECYREAILGLDMVDGMNFSPYMGSGCMKYLVDSEKFPGRSIVGLCRTSNPDAWEIQDLQLADGRKLWEAIAEKTLKWANNFGVAADAGLVMGAAHKNPDDPKAIYSWHLSHCREIIGDRLWFLIPGIGTQGGFVEETVRAAFTGPGSIAINSSSGIIFASADEDYAEAAACEAEKLRDQIREAGGNC